MALTCQSCGAEYETSAKFCRRCGAVVGPGAPSVGPSEATTWTLDTAGQANAGTQNVVSGPTSPVYISPQQAMLAAPDTNSLARRKTNTTAIVLTLIFILILAVGAGAFLMFMVNRGNPARVPAIQGVPQSGSSSAGGSGDIPVPPAPPAPPLPPGQSQGSSASETMASLRYPGSQTITDLIRSDGGMMQLISKDPIERIADWYKARVKADNILTAPGGVTILTSKTVKVIITPSGNGTQIIVKKGSDNY